MNKKSLIKYFINHLYNWYECNVVLNKNDVAYFKSFGITMSEIKDAIVSNIKDTIVKNNLLSYILHYRRTYDLVKNKSKLIKIHFSSSFFC